MAKAKAGRTCNSITLKCVELCGSLGYGEDELLEKWSRDSKILLLTSRDHILALETQRVDRPNGSCFDRRFEQVNAQPREGHCDHRVTAESRHRYLVDHRARPEARLVVGERA